MTRYQQLRLELLTRLGNRCVACGYDEDRRVLQIDHRDGDGAQERRQFRGLRYLEHLLRNLDTGRYQLLCPTCNQIKVITHCERGRRRWSPDDLDDAALSAHFYEPD